MSTDQNSNNNTSSPQGMELKDYHVKFYELCYQQYIHEFERTDKFHQKMILWLTAMLAIGAASYALAQNVEVKKICDTLVFLQCCSVLAVWLPLGYGVYAFYRVLRVRDAKMIATMDRWVGWLDDVNKVDNGEMPPDECRLKEISHTLISSLFRDFATCQSKCFQDNDKRAKWFQRLQDFVFYSALLLAIQAIFGIFISIIG